MSLPFLIDDARVRRLAATRQGRVSLGGFAYQAAYAVARLASLRTGRSLLGLPGVPSLLRYDWAEDLDELSAGDRALLTQCKRIADTGKPASLAGILLGFAPKWLWAPADRRPDLRFRLVCPDPRFAGRGAVLLSQMPKDLRRDEVLAAAETVLRTPPGRSSDRALWQAEAEDLGFPLLLTALWEQTEVLHLAAEPLPEDPAGPLLLAERWALDLLLRERAVDPARQRPALAALRSLLHGNVVEFDPTAERGTPVLDRQPRVLGADDVRYALFDVESPPGEEPPFQVVTRHVLDEAAAEPRRPYVARRPQWSDVVRGQDAEVKFLEREQTGPLLARVRDLLASAAEGEPLPALFVLGAPGAGKTTLARRVAARAVQAGLAVVAAPKLNLDRLDEEDVEPFLRALARLEVGSLPLLLVLDDPLFAESGWDVLLRRLARRSRRVAVLAATPDYLFHQHRHTLGRQLDLQTFPLPRPPREEREALAVLHGRDPGLFADRDDDFLVLAMEASAGASFGSIVDRIWITLNGGVPVSPGTRPEDLPWPARAYLTVCYWHRFGMTCPEVVLRAVLDLAGRDRPAGPAGPAAGFDYELRRLVSEHGWAVFGMAEPVKRHLAFLGLQIGAAHRRIAAEAWQRRPVPAFDAGDWLVRSSVEAQPAAVDLGFLACRVESEREPGEPPLLERLVERWSRAGRDGSLKTRNLCLLYAALSLQGPAAAARRLVPALEACAARQDGQSWLAVLSLLRYPGGRRAASISSAPLPPEIDLPSILRVADLHQAPGRATQLLSAVQGSPTALAVLLDRIAATADDEKAGHLLSRLVAARPRDEAVRARAKSWLRAHVGVPGSSELLVQLVEAEPAEPELVAAGLAWLADHPTHPNVSRLLVHLLAAGPDDPALLRRGEESVRDTGNPRILITLLHAKGADPHFLHLALDWLSQPQRQSSAGRVMRCLGETLAADPPAATAFLSHCGGREHRKLVMEALARALQQQPALAAPLTAAFPALSPEDLSLLLLHLLRVRSEPLEAFLATWLADPRSHHDGGALLRSIRRKPTLRDRLLRRMELDPEVRRDLLAGAASG